MTAQDGIMKAALQLTASLLQAEATSFYVDCTPEAGSLVQPARGTSEKA